MSQKKIPVGLLGATGSVGQKFVEILGNHPWFTLEEIAASDRSEGKAYKDATESAIISSLPPKLKEMRLKKCVPDFNSRLVFSALDSSIAGEIETSFARAGYIVISNAKNHRFDPDVPLIVPEVNPDHLQLIRQQKYGKGAIITNPNCATIGLVLALKPLFENFGLEAVNVVTLQAISGAGYPGLSGMDIIDNAIPYISGEEEKLEREPLKIFGSVDSLGNIKYANIRFSAQCNRIPVLDGHTECVQMKFPDKPSKKGIIESWRKFRAEVQNLELPMAPEKSVHYLQERDYPQPRIHRNMDKGMAVFVGRLRECPLFDYKFVLISHNTIRGAAGGAVLIAELMGAKGYLNS